MCGLKEELTCDCWRGDTSWFQTSPTFPKWQQRCLLLRRTNTFQTLTKASREWRVKTWGLFPSQWLICQTGGENKVWQCLLLELFIFISFFPSYWAFDTNTHKLQTCSRLFLYTPGCWWILDKEPHCCCVFIAAHCPTINRITRKGLIRLIQKLLWSYSGFLHGVNVSKHDYRKTKPRQTLWI